MTISTRVTVSGPLFDSGVESTIKRHVNRFQEDAGQLLVDKVQNRLSKVLVNPTGHYKSKIKYTTLQGSTLISDSGVVYGPWLEGVSSRNARSRFKGYATFRKITQEAEQDALTLGKSEAKRLVKDLS